MYKTLVLIISLGIFTKADAQNDTAYYKYDKPTPDTIRLQGAGTKKICAYTIGSITIYVSYMEFKKSFFPFYKWRIRRMKKYDDKTSPGSIPAWKKMDSICRVVRAQVKVADTVFVNASNLNYWGGPSTQFFSGQMDAGNCAMDRVN